MSAEDLILLCGQDLGRNAEQMGPIIKAIVQEAWCETEESLRELSPQQWAALTFADPLGNRQPLPARLVARIQQRLAEQSPTEQEAKPSDAKPSDVNRTDTDSEDGASSDEFPMPHKSFPDGSKSSKLSGLNGTGSAALIDDDDCSTAVPSEALEDQSEVSVWDTGNLDDLGSCGVLTSAEIRAARLQKLGRAPKGQQGSSSSSSSSTGVQRQVSRAQGAKAKAKSKSALTKGTPAVKESGSLRSSTASSSAAAAASSSGSAALREERLAQLKATQKAIRESSAAASSKPQAAAASSGSRPQSAASSSSSTTASSSCSAQQPVTSSKPQSAAAASSGYVQQPARKPVQTEQKPQVVGQEIPKDRAGRPLTGDELKRHLDKASRETIREMGLWEYMPARNPVVTRAGPMGAHWHQSFEEYQHTLGGVPDPKPVERDSRQQAIADNIQRQLDKQSREALKEMGLWEKMPARNPVVTRQSSMGAHWHASFGEFQHTLGGVPTPLPTSPPMRDPNSGPQKRGPLPQR
mmetsp:Transcript_35455/g.62978  ORF Transcript_35455/g.62978 Transcript_35455/m.62978 type:complete len:523 (-) Transcript_35455:53-1621(-)